MLIIGIPFFLLFVGFTRVLALAEGRLVEGLLGQRMPRRPLYPAKGVPIFERIKQMLVDRRTWTTMFYFLLMLPLGILYFVIATVGICVSIGLIGGSIAGVLIAAGIGGGSFSLDDHAIYFGPSPLAAPFLLIGGIAAADGRHAPDPRHRPRPRHAREAPPGRARGRRLR